MRLFQNYSQYRSFVKNTKKLKTYEREFKLLYESSRLRKTKNAEPVLICTGFSNCDLFIPFYVIYVSSHRIISKRINLIIENHQIKIMSNLWISENYDNEYSYVLLNEIIRWAKKNDIKKILGHAFSHEINDLTVYLKNGFKIDDQKKPNNPPYLLLKLD